MIARFSKIFITLFLFIAVSEATKECRVCGYNGNAYSSPPNDPGVGAFQLCSDRIIGDHDTRLKGCDYRQFYTKLPDPEIPHTQLTYCKLTCDTDAPTECPVYSLSRNRQGAPINYAVDTRLFETMVTLPCPNWPTS